MILKVTRIFSTRWAASFKYVEPILKPCDPNSFPRIHCFSCYSVVLLCVCVCRWFFISEAAAQTAVSPLAARHPPDREDLGPECLWGSADGRPRENKAGEVQATSSKSEHRLG